MAWNVHPVAPRACVQAPPRPQRASAPPVPRAQPQVAQPHIVCPLVCPVVHPLPPRAQPHLAQPPVVHPVVCPVAPRACVQAPQDHHGQVPCLYQGHNPWMQTERSHNP